MTEGLHSQRPVGEAGRGRHTGKVGWMGGKHRKRGGCFASVALTPLAGLLLTALMLLTGCDHSSEAQASCDRVHADRMRTVHVSRDTTAYECVKNGRTIRTIICASDCRIQ